MAQPEPQPQVPLLVRVGELRGLCAPRRGRDAARRAGAFPMLCTYSLIAVRKVRCRGPGVDRTYGPALVQMEGRLRPQIQLDLRYPCGKPKSQERLVRDNCYNRARLE